MSIDQTIKRSYLKDCKKVLLQKENLRYFSFFINVKCQRDLTPDICSVFYLRHISPHGLLTPSIVLVLSGSLLNNMTVAKIDINALGHFD